MQNETAAAEECVVLFSGGTDSTCAAALCAEHFSKVHLLTFFERSTERSPLPIENTARLRAKYGEHKFIHLSVSTDRLVRELSYESYFKNLWHFGFYNLSTPGLSTLSWHLHAIKYCISNRIKHVRDGMTKELLHLPGHMPEVREVFKKLYAIYGITFDSPVIFWEVPPDQRLIDRFVVDRHGFASRPELSKPERTTGAWLYREGIFPHPNVKGSLFDHRMQHDCYPFVVYNVFVFWLAFRFVTMERFTDSTVKFIESKVETAKQWIDLRADLFGTEKIIQGMNNG